jgi:hypothetical protein
MTLPSRRAAFFRSWNGAASVSRDEVKRVVELSGRKHQAKDSGWDPDENRVDDRRALKRPRG